MKQSYFGGHTEIYNLNKSDVWKYDWNSAYPFVMANSTFPTSMNKIVHLPAETTCESVSDCVRLKISQCRLYRLKSFRFLHGWPMIHIRYKESIVLPLQYDGTIWVWGDTLLWSMAITKMSFTYDAVIYSTDPRERSFQFLEDIY